MKTFFTTGLLFFSFLLTLGQNLDLKLNSLKKSKKGSIYSYWGWNRSGYSNSDITFKGNGYDFTLSNVKADDRQSPFGWDPYFKLDEITIPQTNARIGYFINDKYDISIGVDHMKYVMKANQNVTINGTINSVNNPYNNTYQNQDILLTEDFLTFEHTDGLNYINLGFTRNDVWNDLFKIRTKKFEISSLAGLESGILFPKTNTKLMNKERYDEFHTSGMGVSVKVGVNLLFWNHFFIQAELKGGYINMWDIRTTQDKEDLAQQDFFFHQQNIMFGYRFKL